MPIQKFKPLKMKAILISDDDGHTWKIVSQFYAAWQPEGDFSGRDYKNWILKAEAPRAGGSNERR